MLVLDSMWHWYKSWANIPIYFPQMLCEIHQLLHISVWFFWVTFFITILKCATVPVQFNFSIQSSRKQIFGGQGNHLQNCVYREIRVMSHYKSMLILWKTDPLRLHFRVIVMHAILATWPIECYSYSYCVGGSGICMLILCYCMICSILGSWFPRRNKSWAKLLSILLPSSRMGHPGLAINIVQSGQPSVNRYLLCNLDSIVCLRQARHSYFFANYKSLQQLDCWENWILLAEYTSFPRTTTLSVQIYEYHFSWVLKCMLHGHLTIIVFWK